MLLALDVPTHRSGLSCGFQVARSLGILDEVNRMKVVPGTSPSSRQTHKTARYMEVSTDTLRMDISASFFLFLASLDCCHHAPIPAGCCLAFDPASFDSLFPRIPRCCRLQRDSRWRTVFQSIRTGWRCTKQVQLQREEPTTDRVVQVRARLLTGCPPCLTDGSQKTPETPESSASTSSASAGGTSVVSGTSSTSSTSGSTTTVSTPQTSTVKPCSVSVAPLMIPDPPRIPSTESGSR